MKIRDMETYDLGLYDVKDQLKRFVYARSERWFAEGDRERDLILDENALRARQAYIRAKLLEGIGGLPDSDAPLRSKITGNIACDGFTIEKVMFESRPDTPVTSNLYIPDGIDAPRGAVLFLCGHKLDAKHSDYQNICQYFVRAGLVLLAIDPIGQGERLSYYERAAGREVVRFGTGEHFYAGLQCLPLGCSIATYFLHDAMRAIDYLAGRPEVDPAKIGVTGHSGGGVQSALLMMTDPRVAAAAPGTFLTSRRANMYAGNAQDSEQIWPGFTASGLDHEDILIAMAPRPVLVLAAEYDFFPIEGTRSTVERTKRFWEMLGCGDRIDLFEDASVHRYTANMARAAAQFFSRHFGGETRTPSDGDIRPVPPPQLWCTASGQVLADERRSRIVHDENCARADVLSARRRELDAEQRRRAAVAWLTERVFQQRLPCELNPRLHADAGYLDELSYYSAIWQSQEHLFSHAYMFRDARYARGRLPVTIAIWEGGTTRLEAHIDWIRASCHAGRSVMVLDVCGSGKLLPHPVKGGEPVAKYEIVHKLNDDLIWMGDSLTAMRTYDVIRAVDALSVLPAVDESDVAVYGHGRQGLYGKLAVAIDGRISHLTWEQGFSSVTDWVKSKYYNERDAISTVIPGMLSVFDLEDLAAPWNGREERHSGEEEQPWIERSHCESLISGEAPGGGPGR